MNIYYFLKIIKSKAALFVHSICFLCCESKIWHSLIQSHHLQWKLSASRNLYNFFKVVCYPEKLYITKSLKLFLNSFVGWRLVSLPFISKRGGEAVSPQINNAKISRIFIASCTEIRLLPVVCVFIYWQKCLISKNILCL